MEEKKKSNGVLIGIIIVIIIMLLSIGGFVLFTTNAFSFYNTQQKKIENKAEEIIDKSEEITDKAEEIFDKVEEQTRKIEITGKYEQKSETETPYYNSVVEVSNVMDSSIDFKIEASHGLDIDHINIGSVNGTATKSIGNNYIFEEGNSKISFNFSESKLIITEIYEDNINPYGGHGVYFAGEYNKVS